MEPHDASASTPEVVASAGYWVESRQPLASLLFVAPLLAIYEAGIIMLGPQAVCNGADAWLRWSLDRLGFGQYFLLPILTVGILLGWHHTTRRPWTVARGVFYGMTVESLLLACCLRWILHLQGTLLQVANGAPIAGPLDSAWRMIRTGVGFLGAGIYEELLFRLILLSLLLWGLRALGVPRPAAALGAVVASSLLFSAAHYIGAYGEPIHWFSFLFRFLAGVFFGVLFLYRGFGISVGAHAGYDVLVGLV